MSDDTIELLARGYTREQITAIQKARAEADQPSGDDGDGPAPRRRRKA